jgi:hypothetical protein
VSVVAVGSVTLSLLDADRAIQVITADKSLVADLSLDLDSTEPVGVADILAPLGHAHLSTDEPSADRDMQRWHIRFRADEPWNPATDSVLRLVAPYCAGLFGRVTTTEHVQWAYLLDDAGNLARETIIPMPGTVYEPMSRHSDNSVKFTAAMAQAIHDGAPDEVVSRLAKTAAIPLLDTVTLAALADDPDPAVRAAVTTYLTEKVTA